MNNTLFEFEAAYFGEATQQFHLTMHYGDQIVWSAEVPIDFGGQYHTDDPYMPSSPLTHDDLEFALIRHGWRLVEPWEQVEGGPLVASIRPTPAANPQITIAPSNLADLPWMSR